ncbi:MAG: cell division protein FtsW [Bacteroidetes bacterium HGW-Bacteroidetes-6]|jgi:cell division protein FtsW|nr:MAG: cell division protein FtsW [Bacteroidetes bacterium HGW-Bacteroidetes-6]
MKFFAEHIKGDRAVWVIVVLLSIFSVLAVYSSTGTLAFRYQGGNTEYYMLKHLIILLAGLFFMYVFHNIRYSYFSRFAQLMFYISIPLLLFTMFRGTNVNEASRWLTIPGLNISFQSSDIAKMAIILYLARLLALKQDVISDFKSAFIPLILPVVLVTLLIMPANLSTAMLVFGTSLIIMFVGRVPFKFIAATTGITLVAMIFAILLIMQLPGKGRVETWQKRVESFISSDDADNYQAVQAKIAIANGGIWGKMPGNSTQRNFLPHPYSDFIFALIIEEFGLLGGVFILLLYLILLYRGIRIGAHSPGAFGTFLSIGLSFMLVFQALINMGVAVNLLPVTGQPLPLISMGGTSIWFTCISLGIILSVSKGKNETTSNTNINEKA